MDLHLRLLCLLRTQIRVSPSFTLESIINEVMADAFSDWSDSPYLISWPSNLDFYRQMQGTSKYILSSGKTEVSAMNRFNYSYPIYSFISSSMNEVRTKSQVDFIDSKFTLYINKNLSSRKSQPVFQGFVSFCSLVILHAYTST